MLVYADFCILKPSPEICRGAADFLGVVNWAYRAGGGGCPTPCPLRLARLHLQVGTWCGWHCMLAWGAGGGQGRVGWGACVGAAAVVVSRGCGP